MNLQDDGFSLVWIVGGWIGLLIALIWAVKTAPWYKIREDKSAQHVLLGASVVFFLVWNFSASIGAGLTFHFLFMTIATLMFGAPFALMTAFLATVGITLVGSAGWQVLGLNFLIMGWIPIMLSWWIAKLAYRFLDRNFFVFVLLNGFFAAAFSMFIVLMVATGVMWLSGVQAPDVLMQSFIPYIPLIIIPEGFITGMVMGALIMVKPHWISCFTDEQFLKGK